MNFHKAYRCPATSSPLSLKAGVIPPFLGGLKSVGLFNCLIFLEERGYAGKKNYAPAAP